MLENKRLLLLPLLLVAVAVLVLGMKLAYPAHRTIALALLLLAWWPLVASYRKNYAVMHAHKERIKAKTKPFAPHIFVALILLVALYVTWVLFPVYRSPLADLTSEELREEIRADLDSYLILRRSLDDFLRACQETHLLETPVDDLTPEDRVAIRSLWRDCIMTLIEFDILKEKYRGFYQIDFVAEPNLHANAFMLAYMAYVTQYDACLQVIKIVDSSDFMSTLLNEEGKGIPPDSYYTMKQRFTDPKVVLRMNAGAAYYPLVKASTTIDHEIVLDYEERRNHLFQALGKEVDILISNPLDRLERAAFETVFPIQKRVALQMSYIRTTERDYLITHDVIAPYVQQLQPGDILIQRRNWHMTNIGIPGFWPHVALYVGTPDEIETYFTDLEVDPLTTLQEQYPQAYSAMSTTDPDGYPIRVIESIRPGVVMQSLEASARCDYLAVIRPNLSRQAKFEALLAAFSHYGKPYDLNFDFATDNALVCSELIYKAYQAAGGLALEPEVLNGRLLLPPNRLVEDAVRQMGTDKMFSFVLFLDAVEKDDRIVAGDEAAFRASWQRPKWDVMQK